jgi:hypothetical protein
MEVDCMARKLIGKLEVYMDDGTDNKIGSSSIHSPLAALLPESKFTPDEPWIIVLRPKDNVRGSELDVLSHELGHFACQVLRTPASLRDMRGSLLVNMALDSPYGWAHTEPTSRAKYAAESEAWDVARMINPSLKEGIAEAALDTYRDVIRIGEAEKELLKDE